MLILIRVDLKLEHCNNFKKFICDNTKVFIDTGYKWFNWIELRFNILNKIKSHVIIFINNKINYVIKYDGIIIRE